MSDADQDKSVIKVPVSERAMIARINRKLDADGQGEKLHRSHVGSRAFAELGRYFIAQGSEVRDFGLNLERVGRDLKVLAPYERLEE